MEMLMQTLATRETPRSSEPEAAWAKAGASERDEEGYPSRGAQAARRQAQEEVSKRSWRIAAAISITFFVVRMYSMGYLGVLGAMLMGQEPQWPDYPRSNPYMPRRGGGGGGLPPTSTNDDASDEWHDGDEF